jgi:hypothetical protein
MIESKMLGDLNIRFLHKGNQPARKDDVLKIAKDVGYSGLFHVTFRPGDGDNKTTYQTYMSSGRLLDHIENILDSLIHDSDPICSVQVQSPLQPSIMYRIDTLHDEDVRRNIYESVYMYVRSDVDLA